VPTVGLESSPLAGGPATIAYRSMGAGNIPLVFLHGGWGYEVYPFDTQAQILGDRFRVLIPDRSGHGGSTPLEVLPRDFHQRGAEETAAFLDSLGIGTAVWWGHSDGAVMAAVAAIEMPERVTAVILEALHLRRRKPASREFFEQMAFAPDSFGTRVTSILERDHGAEWRRVLRSDGQAWLDLADSSASPEDDVFAGRLSSIRAPVLLVHGGRDPRSEPGEFAAVCSHLPDATIAYLPEAGHSPHSDPATADEVAQAAARFLQGAIS
jgi:pimeloyl-ACP methyl ester carboxylesterase